MARIATVYGIGFQSWAVGAQFTQLLTLSNPGGRENGYLGKPRKGKLWESHCHTCPEALCNLLLPTTGARAIETEMSTEGKRNYSASPQLYLLDISE